MKKLRSIPSMIMTIIGIIMAILVLIIMKDFKGKALLLIPAYEFWFLGWIISTYKAYCKNWISYGDDKIIIKQRRERREPGKLVGKQTVWKDEVALGEIQSYGSLLWNQNGTYFFIRLKDEKMIFFHKERYTKAQIRELCSYIEEHTGIVRTDQKPPVWSNTGEKIFVIVFMLILYALIGLGFYLDFAGK